jgi:hypothetical protein
LGQHCSQSSPCFFGIAHYSTYIQPAKIQFLIEQIASEEVFVNGIWDREELYKEVWAEPIIHVAKRYGISDVAIAKVCRKLNVPVPGRGYWAKKANDHAVKQIPLPPMANPPQLWIPKPTPKAATRPPDPELEEIDLKKQAGAFEADFGAKVHPLIKQARQILSKGGEDRHHFRVAPYGSHCPNVRVSKNRLDRALTLMNCLLHILAREKVAVELKSDGKTVAICPGAEVEVGIRERLRQIEKPPDSNWTYKSHDYVPTGNLLIEIHEYADGIKRVWEDSDRRKLEDQLPDVVAAILKVGVVLRLRAEERKKEELRKRQHELEMYELAKQIKGEQSRVDQLLTQAADWHRAKQLREYIEAYTVTHANDGQVIDPQSDKGQWVRWAKEQADRLDPLTPSPPSILDRKREVGGYGSFNG